MEPLKGWESYADKFIFVLEWTGEEQLLSKKSLIPLNTLQLFLVLSVSLVLTLVTGVEARQAVKIENVNLVPENESQASFGVRFEKERTLYNDTIGGSTATSNTAITYDNTRFRPIRLRMGVLDNMELRLGAHYSSNSPNSVMAPREGGIEGIEIGSKIQWHPNISTTLSAKFNGSDEVYPYGQDKPSFSANIPIKFRLGEGMFHGEAGITLQSGDAFINDSPIGSWSGFGNYGLGYAYDMNRFAEMSIEIVGHTATVDAPEAEDHLELIFGNGIRIARGVRFKPSLGFALMDGSPNTSFGFDLEMAMGNRRLPEPENTLQKQERFSGRSPVGGVTEPQSTVSEESPEPNTKKTKRRKTSESSEDSVNELMRKAYEAAQDGRPEKALDLYQQAYEMEPNDVLLLSNLGSLHYRRENYRKAIEYYRQAVQEDPEDTFSLMYLGASHYQLGNQQAARRYFKEVRNLDPDNERARDWLDEMNS